MNSRIRAKLLPLAIASLLAAPAFAQDTSSAISGRVLDAGGKPVANAEVKLVHEPSGTTKIVQTDAEGRYSAQGLRVGGPFDVIASKDGHTVAEQGNVFLQLAQTNAVNLSAEQAAGANAQALEGVTVSANSLSQTFSPDNKGLSTNISNKELESIPTPGRSIQNVVRLDPRIVITDRARGEISAVGQNSRYNNITVDSVSANDPFGLNANGLPTLGTPISQDAIEEYNISTANYDVATRRGVGANINAVTKSGTNDFHGSVYYAFQNQNMIGDNELNKPYAGFDRQFTAGGTVGGPIIKDKLFFFGMYEKSKQIGSGSPYGPSDSGAAIPVKNLTNAQLQSVRDIANQLGFGDIGSVGGGNSNLQDKRYLGKLDWNITDNHRASFTYSETKEQKPIITGSDAEGETAAAQLMQRQRAPHDVGRAPADPRPLRWVTFGSAIVVGSWIGTSLAFGTPLSMRYAVFVSWLVAQSSPVSLISRPAPGPSPCSGNSIVEIVAQSDGSIW